MTALFFIFFVACMSGQQHERVPTPYEVYRDWNKPKYNSVYYEKDGKLCSRNHRVFINAKEVEEFELHHCFKK